MKELSIEEKAKRYDEALKAVIVAHKDEDRHLKATLERIFHELKESEDERKELLNYLYDVHDDDEERARWIAWLEKQGEHAKFRDSIQVGDKVTRNQDGVLVNLSQLNRVAKKDEKQDEQKPILDVEIPFGAKDSELQEVSYHIPEGFHAEIENNKVVIKKGKQKSADKVEPKFKVGDWVIDTEDNEVFIISKDLDNTFRTNVYRITSIDGEEFDVPKYTIENDYRLWTINDAKEGDVLVGNYDNCKKPWIGIFKCISKDRPTTQFDSYCFLNSSHHIFTTPLSCDFYNQCKGHTIRYALPATKIQRDLLFQKMKEAGYEWDADKKELRKIEQNPLSKFEVGDIMRTLQEATDNITSGLPVVVSIDEEYYHCTNELIAIKDQDDYEYPPMNRRQKPAWSEEDEKIVEHLINLYKVNLKVNHYPDLEVNKKVNELKIFFKSLKDRVLPKHEWSDKDENKRLSVIENLEDFYEYNHDRHSCEFTSMNSKNNILRDIQDNIDWLKSLRPQSKNEWDKNDELNRQDTIRLLTDAKERYLQTDASIPKCIKWLENLSPQSHWKPSDEQMDALLWVIENSHKSIDVNAQLNLLYEQLKALLL